MWNPLILVPLWLVQFFILSKQVAVILVLSLANPLHHKYFPQYSWPLWAYQISKCVCLFLGCFEVHAYENQNLRPVFYLASQAFKSSVFSYDLYCLVLRWRVSARYKSHTFDLFTKIAELSTFLVALAYGLYVLLRERRVRKMVHGRRVHDFHRNANLADELSAFMIPSNLNSSSKLISDLPFVVQMLMWANTDPVWISRMPRLLAIILRPALCGIRWLVAFLPICIWLPTCNRLPGEPEHSRLVRSNPSLADWNYLKPNTMDYEALSDSEQAFQSQRRGPRDEEAAVDILGLHDIHHRVRSPHNAQNLVGSGSQHATKRLLGPRYLCFLDAPSVHNNDSGYTVRKVSSWMAENEIAALPDYVFISYTRRQFYTEMVPDSDEPSRHPVGAGLAASRDKAMLIHFAILAAKEAGVSAFWIDFECVKAKDDEMEHTDMEDVYHICDVVRAAHSLTIVLGPSLDSNLRHTEGQVPNKTEQLLEWGQRLWTVPEALLSPPEHRITIYSSPSQQCEKIAKRNLASYAWDDAGMLRQLIDHYESSLHLTQLELISIALECLQRRQTEQRNQGDVIYALMGLLRLRPKVNKSDSDFQAFARLSLANDSDMILERMMSLRNAKANTAWHDMGDIWSASLWHIDPLFRIADVGHDNTVVISDALGSRIDWASLKMVDFKQKARRHEARWRLARHTTAMLLAYLTAFFMITRIYLPAWAAVSNRVSDSGINYGRPLFAVLGVPSLVGLIVALPIPYWLLQHLKSDHESVQARMFGIEGKPDLGEVESSIFGANCGRIRWSPNGQDEQDEANDTRPQFTLIDTLTCTATTFRARRPPTIAFAGSREGGLLRLLLCSYDAVVGTFVKETVVRAEATVSQRMPRLDRFSLALACLASAQQPSYRDSMDSDTMLIPEIPEFRSLD